MNTIRYFGFTLPLKWKYCIFIATQITWMRWDFHSVTGSAYLWDIYIYYFCKPKSPMTSAPNSYYILIMVSFYQVNHPESLFSCSYLNQLKLWKRKNCSKDSLAKLRKLCFYLTKWSGGGGAGDVITKKKKEPKSDSNSLINIKSEE